MTATNRALLERYDRKSAHYWDRAERLAAQRDQLIREGHRERAARLEVSIASMRRAASEHAGRAIAIRLGQGIDTKGQA